MGTAAAALAVPADSEASPAAATAGNAGGDLGGAYPSPTVLRASGDAFEVAGCVNANLDRGMVLTASGALSAAPDALTAVRMQSYVNDTIGGANGPRGDSIHSDAPSDEGSSFYMNHFISGVHNTRGSYQGYTSMGTIYEAREGDGIYGEMGLYEASLTTDRRGAYTACLEARNAINSGKQARATGLVTLIDEANPLASYSVLSPAWSDTGARGHWLASTGPQPAGTGLFIEGDWARAAVYVQLADQGNFVLLSKRAGAAGPLFRINGRGKMEWGDGTLLTGNLYAGAGGLITDHGLAVRGNTLALAGTAMLENRVAAHESGSASPGHRGLVPNRAAGYLTFRDSHGRRRKIPYFDA